MSKLRRSRKIVKSQKSKIKNQESKIRRDAEIEESKTRTLWKRARKIYIYISEKKRARK